MAYPRFQRARSFKFASRTSGDVSINSTTWVNVDTGLDITLDAQVGDVIEANLVCRVSAASTPYFVADFHTLVSGTPTNSLVTGGAPGTSPASSFAGWARANVPNAPTYAYLDGSVLYAVQAGDLSSGTVTLRLRAVSSAAVTVFASDPALKVFAKNLGPADPH
jgi:hypothetical protein